jgi:hypothetical protein
VPQCISDTLFFVLDRYQSSSFKLVLYLYNLGYCAQKEPYYVNNNNIIISIIAAELYNYPLQLSFDAYSLQENMEEEHHPELIHREEGEVLSVGPVFPISHSTIETGPLNHPTNVLPPQGFVVGNLKPVSSNITSSFEVGSEPVLTMNRPMDMPPPENWRYWDPKGNT